MTVVAVVVVVLVVVTAGDAVVEVAVGRTLIFTSTILLAIKIFDSISSSKGSSKST